MRSSLLLVLFLGAGCAPVLHLTRPTPPEGDFGNVRTLSVNVTTDVGKTVENALVTGLAMGELPVPVPVDAVVKERFASRLEQLGYTVCPASPCGDGEMNVRMTEAVVGTEFTGSGLRSNVRLTARVKVKQQDGQEPYDFTFWDRRSGRVEESPMLVRAAADSLAASFATTLTPGRQASTLPVEDGGPLRQGVNMLLSDNWDGAIAFFTQLTQQQPELPGAWYDLGVAWEAYGDWGQALAAYEQAAARDRKQSYIDAVEAARRRAPPKSVPLPPAQAPVPIPLPAP
jgi:hypothetical protein